MGDFLTTSSRIFSQSEKPRPKEKSGSSRRFSAPGISISRTRRTASGDSYSQQLYVHGKPLGGLRSLFKRRPRHQPYTSALARIDHRIRSVHRSRCERLRFISPTHSRVGSFVWRPRLSFFGEIARPESAYRRLCMATALSGNRRRAHTLEDGSAQPTGDVQPSELDDQVGYRAYTRLRASGRESESSASSSRERAFANAGEGAQLGRGFRQGVRYHDRWDDGDRSADGFPGPNPREPLLASRPCCATERRNEVGTHLSAGSASTLPARRLGYLPPAPPSTSPFRDLHGSRVALAHPSAEHRL